MQNKKHNLRTVWPSRPLTQNARRVGIARRRKARLRLNGLDQQQQASGCFFFFFLKKKNNC